jgi:hypothetical protein
MSAPIASPGPPQPPWARLRIRSTLVRGEVRTVTNDRRLQGSGIRQSDALADAGTSLLSTADESHGMGNLETTPRAGNISSDARAGSAG